MTLKFSHAIVAAIAVSATVSFGATAIAFEPSGDKDRTADVLDAVKSGATLRFAKGEYHFRSPTNLYYYIAITTIRSRTACFCRCGMSRT